MKFFRRIRTNVDTTELLSEIYGNEDAWDVSTKRQDTNPEQRDTNTIVLRGLEIRPDLKLVESQECIVNNVSKRFPKVLGFMDSFAKEIGGELSRATIVRLKPFSRVLRHIDVGSYYFIRDRFHLVLYSKAGSVLISGDEQIRMREGELWWFDNKQHHEAANESDEWRIHLIFDVLPKPYMHLAINPIPEMGPNQLAKDVTNTPPEPIHARSNILRGVAEQAPASNTTPRERLVRATAEQPWLVDRRNMSLDRNIVETVAKVVGQNNKKFHEAIFQTGIRPAPYLFNVLPVVARPQQQIFELSSVNQETFKAVAASPIETSKVPTPYVGPASRDNTSARELVFAAVRDRAILRSSEEQRLISPKGENNAWMMDMRLLFMDARIMDAITELFWETYADKMPFQVGGMEVAAIPLVAAILAKSVQRGTPINGFMVRKERKVYGAGKLYEGVITDDPIVVVDDLINSGSSLEKVRVILDDENKKIAHIFAVVDFEGRRGKEWRAQHQITVTSLFTLSQFNITLSGRNPAPLPPLFTNVWDFSSPDPNFFHRVPKSFPITDGKRVYFGSDAGFFWCLDAVTGAELWKIRAVSPGHKNIFSSPALYDGKVFFGSYDGNVYCLDCETGKEIWRYIYADWVGSSPALAPDLGLLFIGFEFAVEGKRGSIAALNINTGELVWEFQNKRYTHASPAYWAERELVACGSNDNEMFLLEARTGKMLWRFETEALADKTQAKVATDKGSIRHAPAFDKKRNQLITGCANGFIYIIDVDTGLEVWSVKTANTVYTVPLVVGDVAFIGSTDKYMYVLDLEKQVVKKKLFTASKIFGPPRLIEGKVYFGACNGIIYQLDPVTGDITGKHQLPDAVTCAVAHSPETGLFYALTYVNQLFAMKPA